MGLGQKRALLKPWYLFLRASGNIARMVLETKAVFIDLKKAFDTVKNSILLEKFNKLGLSGHMQSFLKPYLSKRQQFVNSGNVYSNFAEVDYG